MSAAPLTPCASAANEVSRLKHMLASNSAGLFYAYYTKSWALRMIRMVKPDLQIMKTKES